MKTTHSKRNALLVAAALSVSTAAQAADLDLRARSDGSSHVGVLPGALVDYEIVGELSDASNQGLAMFTFDLHFTGGPLAQAAAPQVGSTMASFAPPAGWSIPAGFGGLPSAGDLIQVGGAQNTIRNQFAPIPNGVVMTGIALEGSPEVLVTGTLVAPNAPGIYTLEIEDPMANVIRLGSSGVPFWHVTPAGEGTVIDLVIEVVDCTPPASYCTGKVNSQGCTASIGSTGAASLSGPDDFHLTVADVINNQNGIVFWGLSPDNAPFQNGIRCVAHPIVRLAVSNSGGSTPPTTDCSGSFDYHFSQAYMLSKGLTGGTVVYAQSWYRDPAATDGTGVGLSDALSFVICP